MANSQDHLETYFSLVRGSLGANNNPNVQQFRSAYRKLLFCSPHISGNKKTNCNTEFPDELLEVSSALKNVTFSSNVMPANAIEIQEDYETLIGNELEPYDKHMFAIVASNIENDIIRKIMSQVASACKDCAYVFHENSHIQDSLIAKKMKKSQRFHQPSFSTLNIVIASNEVMKMLNQVDYTEFKSVVKTIFNVLNLDSLYEASDFEIHHGKHARRNQITHKEEFILNIVEKYLSMKSKEVCKRITIEERGETKLRKSLNRKTILSGQ